MRQGKVLPLLQHLRSVAAVSFPVSLTVGLILPTTLHPVSVTCVCGFSFLCLFLSVSLCLLIPLPFSFFPSLSLSFESLFRTCSKFQETISFTHDAPSPSQGSSSHPGPLLSNILCVPFQEEVRDFRHYPLQNMGIFTRF